ncbi:hypothetical protein CR513_31569, partial [Mucuna pruriens]
MLIKVIYVIVIRQNIPCRENVKEYIKFIKYDGASEVHEHIIKMVHYCNKLKFLKLKLVSLKKKIGKQGTFLALSYFESNVINGFTSLMRKQGNVKSKIIMEDGARVYIFDIGVVSLCLPFGHTSLLRDMRRILISFFVLDKCGYTFEFGSGKLIINFSSIVVGLGVLCNEFYMLNVNDMSVNSIEGSKRKTNETSSML